MAHNYSLVREQWLPKQTEVAFAFFSRPENLEEITPPWLAFHIVRAEPELHAGSIIEYKLRIRGIPTRWTSEITVWEPPLRFVDTQLSGPYAKWRHEHTFSAERGGTRIRDHVDYVLPFGILGRLVHALLVRRDVETIFQYRRQRLAELLGE